MNTILPRFVEFNKNTTFNTEDMPYWIAISKINLCFACIAVILFLVVILTYYHCVHASHEIDSNYLHNHIYNDKEQMNVRKQKDNLVSCRITTATTCIILAIMTAIVYILMLFFDSHIEVAYNHSGFQIANTNLIASKYRPDTYIKRANYLMPDKNCHESTYYVYVDLMNAKPDGIRTNHIVNRTPVGISMTQTVYGGNYDNDSSNSCHKLSMDIKQSVIYLGKMENGKFIPNYQNAKVVNIFMNYQKYIKKYHLESKFKNHFSFEVSQKYSKDNDPILVVIGNHGFTLHYKSNKNIKDIDIAKNDRSK